MRLECKSVRTDPSVLHFTSEIDLGLDLYQLRLISPTASLDRWYRSIIESPFIVAGRFVFGLIVSIDVLGCHSASARI